MTVTQRHRERGGTTVEFAVSLIVFVPVLLYSLFLDDILRVKLDAQEAVISTTWDLAFHDYHQAGPKPDAVAAAGRAMFCDHSSSREGACKVVRGVAADASWSDGGAQQVQCTLQKGWGPKPPMAPGGKYASTYTKGGLFQCNGRAAVVDHLLPRNFLWMFSGATAISTADVFPLQKEEFAILTDTWALNTDVSGDPGDTSGPLYERMSTVFKGSLLYAPAYAAVTLFAVKAGGSSGLVNPLYFLDAMGDNIMKPDLAARVGNPMRSIGEEGGSRSYQTHPWLDWQGDKPRKVYQERRNHYLGCNTAASRGCN